MRPFVKTDKHDQADAEAVCEAVPRSQMRFVPIKSTAQLDLQALGARRGARDRLVAQRTGLINQIRAFLLERGITVRQGRVALAKALPEGLETDALSPLLHRLLGRLRRHWRALDEQIAAFDQQILTIARTDPSARRLMTIPGIGPLIATGLVAAIAMGLRTGRQSRPVRPSLWPGPRSCLLARARAAPAQHRRQAQVARYRQTRQRLSAATPGACRARPQAQRQDARRPARRLVARARGQGLCQRRHRGARRQARPLGVGGAWPETRRTGPTRISR